MTQPIKLTSEALEAVQAFQTPDLALMYCDVLSQVATYITLIDDPDLDISKQMHWLRSLAMLRKDIQAIADSAE